MNTDIVYTAAHTRDRITVRKLSALNRRNAGGGNDADTTNTKPADEARTTTSQVRASETNLRKPSNNAGVTTELTSSVPVMPQVCAYVSAVRSTTQNMVPMPNGVNDPGNCGAIRSLLSS